MSRYIQQDRDAAARRRARLEVVCRVLCEMLGGADTVQRDETTFAWADEVLEALDAHDAG